MAINNGYRNVINKIAVDEPTALMGFVEYVRDEIISIYVIIIIIIVSWCKITFSNHDYEKKSATSSL